MQHPPRLSEEHFLDVVYGAVDVDVLLITGMTDKAPFALFSDLVPYSRLLDVRVKTSVETRCSHRGCGRGRGYYDDDSKKSNNGRSEYYPNITFNNDTVGDEAVKRYAVYYLLPFFHEDLQHLANKIPQVPHFPRPGIKFRHVLNISQQLGGLALCTSLLQTYFTGDWEG